MTDSYLISIHSSFLVVLGVALRVCSLPVLCLAVMLVWVTNPHTGQRHRQLCGFCVGNKPSYLFFVMSNFSAPLFIFIAITIYMSVAYFFQLSISTCVHVCVFVFQTSATLGLSRIVRLLQVRPELPAVVMPYSCASHIDWRQTLMSPGKRMKTPMDSLILRVLSDPEHEQLCDPIYLCHV